jgi:hypothetical protein
MGKFETMAKKLVNLSESNIYAEALTEWDETKRSTKDAHCLCNHKIRENCHIQNKLNGNTAILGNCCINKLMGYDSGQFFPCIKRVAKDKTKKLNKDVIDFMAKTGAISKSEKAIMSLKSTKVLSEEQKIKYDSVKLELNKRAISLYAPDITFVEDVKDITFGRSLVGILFCIISKSDIYFWKNISINNRNDKAFIKELLPQLKKIKNNDDLCFWLKKFKPFPKTICWRKTKELDDEIIKITM